MYEEIKENEKKICFGNCCNCNADINAWWVRIRQRNAAGDSNTEGVSSVNVTSSEDAGLDSNEVLEEQTTQEDDSEDNTAEDKAAEDIISSIKEY